VSSHLGETKKKKVGDFTKRDTPRVVHEINSPLKNRERRERQQVKNNSENDWGRKAR